MVFWQLTIDANDPVMLARFWRQALGYHPAPPAEPATTWHAHYRARLAGEEEFGDRLFDPAGLRPPIWFQQVPEAKAGKNRLHLDLYPTGRDSALAQGRRIEIVEAKVAELVALGAQVERRARGDDPDDLSITWLCTTPRATSSASRDASAGSRPNWVMVAAGADDAATNGCPSAGRSRPVSGGDVHRGRRRSSGYQPTPPTGRGWRSARKRCRADAIRGTGPDLAGGST